MGNVVALGVGEKVHPDAILEEARDQNLKNVLVIGWYQDGTYYFSGSETIDTAIFLMRNAEYELFKYMDKSEAAA